MLFHFNFFIRATAGIGTIPGTSKSLITPAPFIKGREGALLFTTADVNRAGGGSYHYYHLPKLYRRLFYLLFAMGAVPLMGMLYWATLNELSSYVSLTVVIDLQGSLWTLRSHIGADALSASQILLVSSVVPLAYWSLSLHARTSGAWHLLTSGTILLVCFVSLDLLAFFVFYEAVLVPMFIGILIGQLKATKVLAAQSLVLYTMIGSVPYFTAVLYCISLLGTVNMTTLGCAHTSCEAQLVLGPMLMIAMLVKLPCIPLHVGLPRAHTESPTAGSMLLAGVVLKLGAYGILRVIVPVVPQSLAVYSPLLDMLAIMSAIYGSLLTIRQVDIKRIIAYTSVAHMALVPAAVAENTGDSMSGITLLLCSHGLIATLLFAIVGIWYDRYHSRNIRYARGAHSVLPLGTLFFSVGSLANASFPGTSSFATELLLISAVGRYSHSTGAWLSTTIVLSAVYSFGVLVRICHGTYCGAHSRPADLCKSETLLVFALATAVVLLGLHPMLLLSALKAGALTSSQKLSSLICLRNQSSKSASIINNRKALKLGSSVAFSPRSPFKFFRTLLLFCFN